MDIAILATKIMMAIGGTTTYDADLPQPNIQFRSPLELNTMYYRPDSEEDLVGKPAVAALHKQGAIFLPHGFDVKNLEDRATLSQEIFHYVQYQNGQMDVVCKGKIESEAHRFENMFRAAYNLRLYTETYIQILEVRLCPPQRHVNRINWKKQKDRLATKE